MSQTKGVVAVVGVGGGLGESLAKTFAKDGYTVALIARSKDYLEGVKKEIEGAGGKAKVYLADVTKEDTIKSTVSSILADAASAGLPISSLIYNPSYFVMKSFLETPASEFANGFSNQVLGLVHFAQGFLPKLVEQGSGSILVTGATAALRAGNGFSTFAVAKFGCRALAQSLAREFGPKGVHVAHFILDGIIRGPRTEQWTAGKPQDASMDPDAIAQTYLEVHSQHRSSWTQEVDLRPYLEKF